MITLGFQYWKMFKGSFEIGGSAPTIQKFLAGRDYSQLIVLTDVNSKNLCYPAIAPALPAHQIICVQPGEEHKNLKTCEAVWRALTEFEADRHALLIVLGGGVLGDLGGFCAATFKRGIDFVLMPTTLLAQVDASIGGKLAIDFMGYKNHIGLFAEPLTTLVCPEFLSTLPQRELRSGFAEIIKHCLIGDGDMWAKISQKSLLQQDWQTLIAHSINFKATVIREDPKEKGLRKILNFGHTMGHGLESYFLEVGKPIFHGEAVAAGMVMEAHIAYGKGMIREEEMDEIKSYLLQTYGKVNNLPSWIQVREIIRQDKKNKGTEIRMALLQSIGAAQWDVPVTEEESAAALEFYANLA